MTGGIRQVMINTNGVRLAKDDKFLAQMSALDPVVYFQFDGLREETYLTIRGEPLLDTKILALDRLADAGMSAVLVAAIERGVNTDEVGAIVEFGLQHPAVRGVVFQPVTHVGRHIPFDPMTRVTIPDIIHGIVDQSGSRFVLEDFVPVPCCFPTCQVNSYIFVDGDTITPLPRLLDIDQYLDYITNRALPKAPDAAVIQEALEGLWSASAVAGTEKPPGSSSAPAARPRPTLRDEPSQRPRLPDRHQRLPRRLHLQREAGYEVLCRHPHPRRPRHPLLCVQLGGLSRANPRPAHPRAGPSENSSRHHTTAPQFPSPLMGEGQGEGGIL